MAISFFLTAEYFTMKSKVQGRMISIVAINRIWILIFTILKITSQSVYVVPKYVKEFDITCPVEGTL